MSAFPANELVVVDIAGTTAKVHCDSASGEALQNLGFLETPAGWTKPIGAPEERLMLVRALLRIGAVFSEGRDWSPAELVAMYVDQGAIEGPYRTIRWRDPDTYQIDTVS